MDWHIAFLIGFIAGIAAGILFAVFGSSITKPKPIGNLVEDHSDPGEEAPLYFMEIYQGGLQKITTSHYVTLKVERRNYISAK